MVLAADVTSDINFLPSNKPLHQSINFLSRSTAFIQEASVHEARRPPMTNAHALLDDTETAFRQVHASEQLFACIFNRVNISWVRGQLMRSPACTDPKRSILRGQNSRRNYTGGFWSWPPATDRRSTRRSVDHHRKGNGKKSFDSKNLKKVKLVRISHWSENDKNAIDYEIARDCVKRANMVLSLHNFFFARTHTAIHNPASAQRLKLTMVTSIIRQWSPQAYALTGQ